MPSADGGAGLKKDHESKIYAVRTPIGREGDAAEMISSRAKYKNFRLKAVLISPETDGYIFVEAEDVAEVLRATEDVRLAREVLETPASEEDVDRIMNPRPTVDKMSHDTPVLITGGEFSPVGGRRKVVEQMLWGRQGGNRKNDWEFAYNVERSLN